MFVAAGTGFYGYKVEFEKSKPVVWVGLILCVSSPVFSSFLFLGGTICVPRVNRALISQYVCAGTRYILLTIVQALYAYFIEGDVVFVGKRKTLDKRVCFPSILHPPPFPLHSLDPIEPHPQIVTERLTIASTSTPSKPSTPPAYSLTVAYVRSASGGKSLLGKGRASAQRGYQTFFDGQGVLDQEAFEQWVGLAVVGAIEQDKKAQ